MHIKYSNINSVNSIHCPVLILHSRQDSIVYVEHSRLLYKAFLDSRTKNSTSSCEDNFENRDNMLAFECSVTKDLEVTYVEMDDVTHDTVYSSKEWILNTPSFINAYSLN